MIERARAALRRHTPLNTDCGLLCGRACCAPGEDDSPLGMWLFPGEETRYGNAAWCSLSPVRLSSGEEVCLLTCNGSCPRDERPLACMFFPLVPVFRSDGTPCVRMDRGARHVCPLASSGVSGLSPEFVAGARDAVGLLGRDERTRAHIALLTRVQKEYTL